MQTQKPSPLRCEPPTISACSPERCECVLAPLAPYPVCTPPSQVVCNGEACACVLMPQQSLVLEPPLPEDGCAIVLSIIVAGVKKSLLTCWVDG